MALCTPSMSNPGNEENPGSEETMPGSVADVREGRIPALKYLLNAGLESAMVLEGGPRIGAIVFGSDQSACGQLNDQVVSYSTRALTKLAYRHENQAIAAVGIRAASKLEGMGFVVETSLPVPASIAGITPAVEEVLRRIDEWHFQRRVDLVVLFCARPISGARYRIQGVRLLPVDERWINSLEARKWPTRAVPRPTGLRPNLFRR